MGNLRKIIIPIAVVLVLLGAAHFLLTSSLLAPLMMQKYSTLGITLGSVVDQVGNHSIVDSLKYENNDIQVDFSEAKIAIGSPKEIVFSSQHHFPLMKVKKGSIKFKKPLSKNPIADFSFAIEPDVNGSLHGLSIEMLTIDELNIFDHQNQSLGVYKGSSANQLKIADATFSLSSLNFSGDTYRINAKGLSASQGIVTWEALQFTLDSKDIPALAAPISFNAVGKIMKGIPEITFMDDEKKLKLDLAVDQRVKVTAEKIDLSKYFKRKIPALSLSFRIPDISWSDLWSLNIAPHLSDYSMILAGIGIDARMPMKEKNQPEKSMAPVYPIARVINGGNKFSFRFEYEANGNTLFAIRNPLISDLKQSVAKMFFNVSQSQIPEDSKGLYNDLLPLFRIEDKAEVGQLMLAIKADTKESLISATGETDVKVPEVPVAVPAMAENASPGENRQPAALTEPMPAPNNEGEKMNPITNESTLYPLSFVNAPMFKPSENEDKVYSKEIIQVDEETKVIVQRNPQGYKIMERTFRKGRMIKSVYWSNNDQGKLVLLKEWPAQ